MSDPDEEELLEAIRKNREAREIRREAIEFLRARTVRNVPLGMVWTALVIALNVARLWVEGLNEGKVGPTSISIWVMTFFALYQAVRCFHPCARDRLLLLLAEESRSKDPPISSGGKRDDADLS